MRISKEPIAKQVFGSRVKRRILEFLFSNQEAVSERELSRILGTSHTAVNKAMRELLGLNLVRGKSVGAAMVWEMNDKSFAYPYVKALINAPAASSLEHVKKTIRDHIETLNKSTARLNVQKNARFYPKIKAAYLFGSVAEETATPESDIDVLIVLEFSYRNESLMELLQSTIGMRLLEDVGNRTSFHIYDTKAVENNKPEWLSRAVSRGIRVY